MDTTYGYYPVNISFSDMSQQGTAAITNWFWDFGDDSTSVLQNPTHTYTKDSTFTVSLIVTDTNNIKDTLIKTDYIRIVAAPPIADFSADTTEWYISCFTVNFTDESIDGSGGIDEWSWDFGDDSTSSLQHPTHIYQDTGTYTVTLMVKDQNDSTDIKIKTDYITVLPGTYIAGGYVSGTWTKANEPYVIGGEITVHANNSLTIDPGVKVLFLGHHKFVINGQLLAQGSANDSIIFTAHNIWQGWHGLRFINSNSSVLEYCLIQYGNATGTASMQDSCGGGIYCENSPIQISNCLIGQNLAYKHGGGIYCELSDIQISNSILQYNTAYEFGGGIYGFDSGITATGDTLERNEADLGGGIYCEGDPFPILMEVLFDKNIAFTSGGGVFCRQGGNINIQQSILIGNVANGNGAGIYFGTNTNPILEGVTIEDNDAGSNGGGLFFNGSSAPSFTNITIVRNSATKGGGMFFNGFNDPNIVLFDIPVTMNNAGNGGGIYYNNSSGPGLINVQITGNSAGGE
ncbi:MAG: PKD domain-containing protein, partial [Pirellulales bacterium]|nr:PKD domain-containing protein [Pirellulales bacterium]